MYFFRILILLNIIFFTSFANAACEDVPTNEVDWTNCNFVDQTDFSANLQFANCNRSVFDNSNLAKVNFEGSNLYSASFKGANLFEANLTGANITNAVFEEANLSNVTWVDGKKCALGSIGTCD